MVFYYFSVEFYKIKFIKLIYIKDLQKRANKITTNDWKIDAKRLEPPPVVVSMIIELESGFVESVLSVAPEGSVCPSVEIGGTFVVIGSSVTGGTFFTFTSSHPSIVGKFASTKVILF